MSKPTIKIFQDLTSLHDEAVSLIVSLAKTAIQKRGKFLMALAGGGTPKPIFRLLSQPPRTHQIDWQHVLLFWGDERFVAPKHEESNYGLAQELLLRHIPIPKQNIYRMKGEVDMVSAVADYTYKLAQVSEFGRTWPRLDLAIMGMGNDGHTASLFAGKIGSEELLRPVMAVNGADYDSKPSQRLTLTPLVFNDARHVLFLATGTKKAETVTAVFNPNTSPANYPAKRIQPHNGSLSWFLDQGAASNLVAVQK